MPQGKQKVGKNTAGHLNTLKAQGYEVEQVQDGDDVVNLIECEGFHTDKVDATTEEKLLEAVRAVRDAKMLFTYKTKFDFGGEAPINGIAACGKLGELSAFIAKDAAGGGKKKATGPKIAQL